jgi:hypothetical protein
MMTFFGAEDGLFSPLGMSGTAITAMKTKRVKLKTKLASKINSNA